MSTFSVLFWLFVLAAFGSVIGDLELEYKEWRSKRFRKSKKCREYFEKKLKEAKEKDSHYNRGE